MENRRQILLDTWRLFQGNRTHPVIIRQMTDLASALFPDPELAVSRVMFVWQKAMAGNTDTVASFVRDCYDANDSAFPTDLLLDLLLSEPDMQSLSQLRNTALPYARWQRAFHMIVVLMEFTEHCLYRSQESLTNDDLRSLARMLQQQHQPESADMFVVAVLQLRTWTNPRWLTPVAMAAEMLIERGHFDPVERLMQHYRTLELGKARTPFVAYLQEARLHIQEREAPLSCDYLMIAASILGQGSGTNEVLRLYGR
jgi:hypothetical protein